MASELSDLELIRIPLPSTNQIHAWYKFYVFINEKYLSSEWSRERIIFAIRDKGFPAFSGSCSEIYLEKSIIKAGFRPKKRLPISRELGETSLMFLVHPIITQQMNDYSKIIKTY